MSSELDILIKHYKELPVIKRAFIKLRKELPDGLFYHSAEHSEDVFCEAIRFAQFDRLSEKEILLLAVASAYHDCGFLVRYTDNEVYGADLAALAMEESGLYSPHDIELVHQMILDTAIVETKNGPSAVPNTKLSGYLLDADVSNLGRDDFFIKTELIAKERKLPLEQLYVTVLKLMKSHSWFTSAAKQLRSEKKLDNIKLLEAKISEIQKS